MKHLWIAPMLMAGALVAGCAEETTDATPVETAAPEVAAPAVEAPVVAESTSFTATLAAPEGIESTGTGTGTFMLTGNTLDYTITYEGLTGPAGAAHIHGPAEPGANAGVVVPFADAASPITGTAELTAEQIAEMEAGKYYVNIHTAANGGGEIRGTIMAQ